MQHDQKRTRGKAGHWKPATLTRAAKKRTHHKPERLAQGWQKTDGKEDKKADSILQVSGRKKLGAFDTARMQAPC
jgi:hypothetical protein